MSYEDLLKNAPAHETPEFLQYLKNNNKVVFESGEWLVIENCKYHTTEKPWYTAFWKGHDKGCELLCCEWWQDIDELWYHNDWEQWQWLKKGTDQQSVKRFHIHIHK